MAVAKKPAAKAAPRAAATKTVVNAESIALKSIEAMATAENVLSAVKGFNAEVTLLKTNVTELKAEWDLGLKKFEVEIEEDKAKLKAEVDTARTEFEEDKATKELEAKEAIAAQERLLESKKADVARQKEELTYELSKHIERENLYAAEAIAVKYDKVVVDKDKISELNAEILANAVISEEALEEQRKKMEASKAIAISSVTRDAASTLSITQGKLEAALERANKAEEREAHLQTRLDKVPEQIKDAVAAAKSELHNHNVGK